MVHAPRLLPARITPLLVDPFSGSVVLRLASLSLDRFQLLPVLGDSAGGLRMLLAVRRSGRRWLPMNSLRPGVLAEQAEAGVGMAAGEEVRSDTPGGCGARKRSMAQGQRA